MSGYSISQPAGRHRLRQLPHLPVLPTHPGWFGALAARRLLVPSAIVAVHLFIVQLVAMVAFSRMAHSTTYDGARARIGLIATLDGAWARIVTPLSRWDGLWYAAASRKGYRYNTVAAMERFGSSEDTLWPLLPWLMRAGSTLTGLPPEAIGFLFVNACFAGAMIALYRLIADEFGMDIARRALWCLVLLPASFYFQAVSTEAPFLLLAALASLATKRKQWLLAGMLALLAAMLRSQGALLIAPLLVLAIGGAKREQRRIAPSIAWLLLPLLGPLVMLWHWTERGVSWSQVLRLQQSAFTQDEKPWTAVSCAIRNCASPSQPIGPTFRNVIPEPSWHWVMELLQHPSWALITSPGWRRHVAVSTSVDLVVAAACLLLVFAGLTRLPLWMNVYVLTLLTAACIRLPLDAPFIGFARFSLLLFPLAIVLAKLLDDTLTRLVAAGVGLVLLAALTAQFANGYWVS